MKTKFLRLAVLALMLTALGALLAVGLTLSWASRSGSAAPAAASSLACSVKPADPGCDTGAGEVAVFRLSSTSNAHAGTAGGSSYGNVVCCGGVTGLGTDCSGTYDTVLTLSTADNAHVASDASYPEGEPVCLSVGAGGSVDCTYGPDCGDDECVATVSGDSNAHVADCGAGAYATKVCCDASAQDCSAGVDTDIDGFNNDVECYLPTDPADNCRDGPGDDAWPLDVNMDTYVTVSGDIAAYTGRLGSTGGLPPSPNWRQRLDLNKDNFLTVSGDIAKFTGKLGSHCT